MREAGVVSLIGQRLGAYQLEAEIGRGSMGMVFLARGVNDGKPYAVKVLLDALVTDLSFITRFTREAHIISMLRHPNLVRLYEMGQDGERIYFVMEYFPGVTAGQLLKERRRLPYNDVIEIAAQAADALAYAHVEGHLVHRDIKPENIMVDRWRRVKVLDFGLARIEGLDTITRQGTVVGSLYYVSPEQLLGRKLDGRTDVYALGISMYEMLTGQRPYRGQTLPEMSDAILYGTAPAPGKLESSVPPALEAIIARAMARDLQQRYANAGELYTALRALQTTLPPVPTTSQPGFGVPAPNSQKPQYLRRPPNPQNPLHAQNAPQQPSYDPSDPHDQNGHSGQITQPLPLIPHTSGAFGQAAPPSLPRSRASRTSGELASLAPDPLESQESAEQPDHAEQIDRATFPSSFIGAQRSLRTTLRPTTLEPVVGEQPQPQSLFPAHEQD